MSRSVALICTLAAGLIVGVQPAANAALSRHVGDLGAAFTSLLVSMTIVAVVLVAFGDPGRLSGLSGIQPQQLLGGIGGAAVVSVGLVAVRPLGAAAVVALLVAAQLVASVAADRFGWFGLHQVGIGSGRIIGLVLVVAGTVLVTRS